MAWKGAHRAVASAREVVSVTETAPLIPNRQRLPCHAGPKMVAGQKKKNKTEQGRGKKQSICPFRFTLKWMETQLRREQLFTQNDENKGNWRGLWEGLTLSIKIRGILLLFLSLCGPKAQQGGVY